jgi:hypothetical protein
MVKSRRPRAQVEGTLRLTGVFRSIVTVYFIPRGCSGRGSLLIL